MPNDEQQRFIFDKLKYRPSSEQWDIHKSKSRIRLVAGGERGGKSKSSANDLLSRFYEGQLYWLVAADYERTRAEYDYICEGLDKLGWNYTATKHVDPGCIDVAGGFTIETKSAKDPRKIAMKAPDGILGCEASQLDYETFLRLRGRIAEKRGWMLLSGCLAGDSLIPTSKGLLNISEIVGTVTHPLDDITVPTFLGKAKASLAFYNGAYPTTKVSFDKGFALEGTPDHKIIAKTKEGTEWVTLENLKVGQLVPIVFGTNLYGTKHYDLEETYLAGVYIAEGSWERAKGTRRGVGRITFTNTEEHIINLLKKRSFTSWDGRHWRKSDKRLAKFFKFIQINPEWKAHTKEVPRNIRESDRKTQVAFLQGLFDGDGTATNRAVSLRTVSNKLAKQVQAMLLNIGVIGCLTEGYYKSSYDGQKRYICDLTIYDSKRFANLVGFQLQRKQEKALTKRKPKFIRNQKAFGDKLLGNSVFWVKVKAKEVGFNQSYDLHIPLGHCYIANGIWVHNTFESSLGWYPELYQRGLAGNDEGLQSFSLPTWSNLAIYPGGREDPEIKSLEAASSEEWFLERYGGKPCPPKGRVIHEFQTHIHTGTGDAFEFDPTEMVYIWIDPGYAHFYAVEVAQKKGDEIYIVDEIFEKGLVTDEIITICKQKPWWNRVIGGAIDIAGTQHQAMAAPTEIWARHAGVGLRSQRVKIEDGIERMKSLLKVNPLTGRPALFINSKCKGLISEMGGCPNPHTGQTAVYRWRMDREGNIIGDVPEDKNCDAVKATIYGLVDLVGYSMIKKKPKVTFH